MWRFIAHGEENTMSRTLRSSFLLAALIAAFVGCNSEQDAAAPVSLGEQEETIVPKQVPAERPSTQPDDGELKTPSREAARLAVTWPLVNGYSDPNQIVYDREHFEGYRAYYANRTTICGIGPLAEITIGDAPVAFRFSLDWYEIGTRFHIDHLRRFLRARIVGTTQAYSPAKFPDMHPYERDVHVAMRLVASARVKDALPEVIELLSDRSRDVKRSAIEAIGIGGFGDDAVESIPKLVELLESDLAHDAAWALASIGEEAVSALSEKVNKGSTDARFYSIEALGNIGPPAKPAVDELIKALYEKKDDHSYISPYAAQALGRIQDERALPHLRKMSDAKNHDVRTLSQRAIAEIEGQPSSAM